MTHKGLAQVPADGTPTAFNVTTSDTHAAVTLLMVTPSVKMPADAILVIMFCNASGGNMDRLEICLGGIDKLTIINCDLLFVAPVPAESPYDFQARLANAPAGSYAWVSLVYEDVDTVTTTAEVRVK